jgi:tetratricopeptide (TPR) repeat protein
MGSIRPRTSISIAPGLRSTAGNGTVGSSPGVTPARYSVDTSGRRPQAIGTARAGDAAVSTETAARGRREPVPDAEPIAAEKVSKALPRAGLFANATEKRYREGLVAYIAGDREGAAAAFRAVADANPTIVSARLFEAISLDADDATPRQIAHLESVVTSTAPFPDPYLRRYLANGRIAVPIAVKITDVLMAELPVDKVTAALALAEAYQETGRLDEAIGLVQQLHEAIPDDRAIRLSLADLLFEDGDYDGVVEVAGGVTNEDDLTAALLHMRAAALLAKGDHAAAFDAFDEALATTDDRDPALLAAIREDRATAQAAIGAPPDPQADLGTRSATDAT